MNKMEILKMAFEKASDPKEAIALAKEMAAFLGEREAQKPDLLPVPIVQKKQRRQFWQAAEIERLAVLNKRGKSVEEIAKIMGRSEGSIRLALYRVNFGDKIGTPKANQQMQKLA
jgi:predicted amidophosphoribosyltransferase